MDEDHSDFNNGRPTRGTNLSAVRSATRRIWAGGIVSGVSVTGRIGSGGGTGLRLDRCQRVSTPPIWRLRTAGRNRAWGNGSHLQSPAGEVEPDGGGKDDLGRATRGRRRTRALPGRGGNSGAIAASKYRRHPRSGRLRRTTVLLDGFR